MRLFSFVFLLFSFGLSYAQRPVKAVLVQLSTEHNRVSYFQNGGHLMDAAEIAREAKKVRRVTMLDFKDNFDYCPVYFFTDSNRDAIISKHFDGLLMDSDGNIVSNPIINTPNSAYVIAYYGYSDVDKTVAPDHKSLIILNDEFQQIYIIFKSVISQQELNNKYTYVSPKYDIDYAPHAERLNNRMDKIAEKLGSSRE